MTRGGDADRELAIAVERFPVQAHGQRNDVMVRLVCRLMGQGYVEDVIEEVVDRWWRHFYDLGTIRTSPAEAGWAIAATIRAINKSGTLRRAVGIDHRAKCRQIGLTKEQEAWLTRGVVQDSQLQRPLRVESHTPLHKKPCQNRVAWSLRHGAVRL